MEDKNGIGRAAQIFSEPEWTHAGRATGIHANTLRKYESGRRKPKIEQLKRIADGLGISVIEFPDIEIENEADLVAVLKKVSPFFKWNGIARVLEGKEQQ